MFFMIRFMDLSDPSEVVPGPMAWIFAGPRSLVLT